jgi:hypothetical protein
MTRRGGEGGHLQGEVRRDQGGGDMGRGRVESREGRREGSGGES